MASFTVRNLTPAFGAEVQGLDLSGELDPSDVAALRRAFDERSVLLVRGELAPEDQQYLTGMLVGQDAPADRTRAVAQSHLYENYVTNRDEKEGYAPFGELLFHSDMMWGDNPMQAISLYGYRVEPPSVPTRFASTAYACETLPDDLRTRVEGLQAVHQNGQIRRGAHKDELVQVDYAGDVRTTVKPVIWEHPRTGRPLLYVSQQMTARIDGLGDDESEALLEELFAHLYRPENLFEHDWRQGDLVVWDNLAAQHARGNVQLEGPERTLRKVLAPVQRVEGLSRPKMVDVAS
jgi:taurine dioxygenase